MLTASFPAESSSHYTPPVLGDEEERGGVRLRSIIQGAEVVALAPGGNGAAALLEQGFSEGDVVTAVDGREIVGKLVVEVFHAIGNGAGDHAWVEGSRLVPSFPSATKAPLSGL
eukprot:CAMPEP_0114140648 /NCGR_PEP_ID=MMETSP0043_2-20121206/17495_1 /TAXON_ID=464988 /ORGANISM="Hemiselmis andersenii, Strain CCMP644" /LENGTH=113 /DNA_ID=CAMNT_0001234753 /DNA_START=378 /DNA_END=715 /DNA_ORIENTATION=+